ncbi:MAG: glycosyltransferase family 39 protein [Thermoanaerobaculia bacterium]
MVDRVAPWLVFMLLACAAALAWSGARSDSLTVDEPSHLVAGYAALTLGDFRLSPDHPPLARLLLALPLLGRDVSWQAAGTPEWEHGDFFTLGREFFERWNDGQALMMRSRAVAIGLMLGLLAAIWTASRRLFGEVGGLVSLTVAAFDPALIAHGHLATIDVPFAAIALSTLIAGARWAEARTSARLLLFAASFAAATVVKYSWVALIPAVAAILYMAHDKSSGESRLRGALLPASVLALMSLSAIWAAYGFRYSAFASGSGDSATMHVLGDFGRALPTTGEGAWESVLHDPATGRDRAGPTVALLRVAHSLRILPEAYLYGTAYVQKKASARTAYLFGETSSSGFPTYFFWVYVLKTPIPSLLLSSFGIFLAARYLRPRRSGDAENLRRWPPLAVGGALFAVTYLTLLMTSGLNIGYRHLLPATAVLMVAAGAFAPWIATLTGHPRRWVSGAIAAALVGLAVTTTWASPLLLGYFNEAAGGWRVGHRYLADSNLDWGQDLRRLADRFRQEPENVNIWLAQAGDPPRPRDLRGRWLWGDSGHEPDPHPIAGGLYAVSATDLVGVYRPLARGASWRSPRLIARYEQLWNAASNRRGLTVGDSALPDDFEVLRRLRLVSRLSSRAADERIGTSIFLFRLSDAQVREWTTP